MVKSNHYSMKIFKISLVFLLPTLFTNAQIQVDELRLYKEFNGGGSTNGILIEFEKKMKNQDDSLYISDASIVKNSEFEAILKAAKRWPHFQMKIKEELAGVFVSNKVKHYFVICSPDWIVDMTDKKNYTIKNKQDQMKLLEMMEALSKKGY